MIINQPDTYNSELLSARQAAAMLPATGHQTVLRWAKKGSIPSILLPSGRRYFRRSDIESLLEPVLPPVVATVSDEAIGGGTPLVAPDQSALWDTGLAS